MSIDRPISMRWRVTAPLLAGVTGLGVRGIAAQDATPVPGSADPLSELLNLVPASVVAGSDIAQIALYADVALQLATAGLPVPDSVADDDPLTGWIAATRAIGIAGPFRERALQLTRDLIGFDVTDIDQSIEAGVPPDMITVLRGRFDANAISAAWVANGYELSPMSSVRAASLSKDGEINFDDPLQQMVIGRMNNVVMLDDSTIVYARTWDAIETVLSVRGGQEPALGARVDIAKLLPTAGEPFASAFLVPGTAFQVAPIIPDSPEAATQVAEIMTNQEPLPPLALGVVGITPGGPIVGFDDAPIVTGVPEARVLYRVLMVEPGSAEQAVPIVKNRLETAESMMTRQKLSEMYGSWDVRSLDNGDVLAIDLTIAPDVSPNIWIQPLYARDVVFLAW